MSKQDLGFDVFAHDKTGRTFAKLAHSVEQLSDKLKELDRQRANPEIDVDTQRAMVQARRAARAFADGAEDEAGKRKRGFFLAMFKPNRAVLSALRTGVPAALSSPIGLAGLTLGGVFAASFAGAVVSSGALATIGAGFTGLAALALKENQRLKDSFSDLGQSAKTDLVQAATPLVPTFDKALSQVDLMLDDHIRDPLEGIFGGLEPVIVPAAESAVRTVGNILDRLDTPEFLTGMQTVTDEISREMPRLGDAVGDFFVTLAENGDDTAEAFSNVVTVLDVMLGAGAATINFLTDGFNTLADVTRPVVDGMQALNAEYRAVAGQDAPSGFFPADMLSGAGEGVRFINGLFDDGAGHAEKFASEIQGLNNRAEQAAREGLAQMAERQKQLTDAIDGTSDLLSHERDKLDQLKDSMFAAAEGVLGLRESTRTYEESLDSASETIARNGETLDVNTEKGRQNQEAIDDIAASALGHIEMMIRQGAETDKVSKFTEQAREDFINAADAAGMEREEARKLADKLGLIPSEVETKIQAIDEMSATIDSLKRQLRELQRQAGVVPIGTSVGAYFGSSLIPPSEFHTGGIIGQGGTIPRAHSGLRLGSDERLIIGQTGERILSREQTRAFEAQGGVDALMRGGTGDGMDERSLASAVARAINGSTIIIDDRGRGRMIARQADLLGRAG